ncbi:unnamed protein product [Urochloa humidicola]
MNTFIFLSNGTEDTQPASPSSHLIDSRFGFVQLRDTVKAFRKEKPHPGRKIILLKCSFQIIQYGEEQEPDMSTYSIYRNHLPISSFISFISYAMQL